jgi:hypothetical protein
MPQALLEERVVEDKRLGRHINHDPKSRLYRFQAEDPRAALVSVEHDIELPFIIDQGNLGRCVPCTGTAYVAWATIWNTLDASVKNSILSGDSDDFTKQLYRDVTRQDPFPGAWEPDDTGSDGLTLAKVLKARGYINGYVHTFNPAEALQALQTAPLAIGIEWLSGCDNPNSEGLISYTGSVRGGHEILVVGYIAERQWVKIRNSWGPWWGADGYFYMTVADFTRAIQNWGDVIILVPNTAPAPEPVVHDEADLALLPPMNKWSSGIISRYTNAGKAVAAYKKWKDEKGLTGL